MLQSSYYFGNLPLIVFESNKMIERQSTENEKESEPEEIKSHLKSNYLAKTSRFFNGNRSVSEFIANEDYKLSTEDDGEGAFKGLLSNPTLMLNNSLASREHQDDAILRPQIDLRKSFSFTLPEIRYSERKHSNINLNTIRRCYKM